MARPSFCICTSVCISAWGKLATARAICIRLFLSMGSCSIIIWLTMDRFLGFTFSPAASKARRSVGFCALSSVTGRMDIWSPVLDFTSNSMGWPFSSWTPASILAEIVLPSLSPRVTWPFLISVTIPSNTLPGISSCACATGRAPMVSFTLPNVCVFDAVLP